MSRPRIGIHPELEREANLLLKQSLKGVTSFSEKSDILTPWKEKDRARREVPVPSGVPDTANRRGIYGRARNASRPDLNSRDGVVRASRTGGTLSSFILENGGSDPEDRS